MVGMVRVLLSFPVAGPGRVRIACVARIRAPGGAIARGRSVGGEQVVLAEQGFEAGEALQVLGAQAVVEPPQVALHLGGAPAGARLALGDPRERCETRRERGLEACAPR